MRFAAFLVVCMFVAALIITWRVAPVEARTPVRQAVRRHWWVAVLVVVVLFSIVAGLAPLNIRLF